jgi:hypothetical protein
MNRVTEVPLNFVLCRLQIQLKAVLFLSSALHIHELAVSFLTVFNYNRGFD